jgi:hypothetical protein
MKLTEKFVGQNACGSAECIASIMGDEMVSPVAQGGIASITRQGLGVGWVPRAHQSGALDAMFPFAKLRWAGAAHPTRLHGYGTCTDITSKL